MKNEFFRENINNAQNEAREEEKKLSEEELRGKISVGKFVCFFRQGESGSSIGEVVGWSNEKNKDDVLCPKVETEEKIIKVLNDDYCVEGVYKTREEAEKHYKKEAKQEEGKQKGESEEKKEPEIIDFKQDIPGIGSIERAA